MIPVLILASMFASPPTVRHREALRHRLARVQTQIDRTMDLDRLRALNAEYARLQRELDKRDMERMKANTREMERLLK